MMDTLKVILMAVVFLVGLIAVQVVFSAVSPHEGIVDPETNDYPVCTTICNEDRTVCSSICT